MDIMHGLRENKIKLRQIRGIYQVPLVHCTYLIKTEVIPKLHYYEANSGDYEFVIFAKSARNNNVNMFIDNQYYWGFIIFENKIKVDYELLKLLYNEDFNRVGMKKMLVNDFDCNLFND